MFDRHYANFTRVTLPDGSVRGVVMFPNQEWFHAACYSLLEAEDRGLKPLPKRPADDQWTPIGGQDDTVLHNNMVCLGTVIAESDIWVRGSLHKSIAVLVDRILTNHTPSRSFFHPAFTDGTHQS